MTQIFLAFHGGLALLRQQNGRWTAELSLVDKDCHCLAVDPHRLQRLYWSIGAMRQTSNVLTHHV